MRTLYHYLDLRFPPLSDMVMPVGKRISNVESDNIHPSLNKYLSNSGLGISHSEIFYSPPGFNGIIHIDGTTPDSFDVWPSRCKLNFVTPNPNFVTTWYDVLPDNKNKFRKLDTMVSTNFTAFDADVCTEIETVNVNGWHLFESGIPHAVRNKSMSSRWCISFVLTIKGLNTWITVDEVMKRLMSPSFNG